MTWDSLRYSWMQEYNTEEELVADIPTLGYKGVGWYNSPSGQTALVTNEEGRVQVFVWDGVDPRDKMRELILLPAQHDAPDIIVASELNPGTGNQS